MDMKKNFLNTEQVFIYLGISLLYSLGIVFFVILMFGIDLCEVDLAKIVSLYSVLTAAFWTYFICKKLP